MMQIGMAIVMGATMAAGAVGIAMLMALVVHQMRKVTKHMLQGDPPTR